MIFERPVNSSLFCKILGIPSGVCHFSAMNFNAKHFPRSSQSWWYDTSVPSPENIPVSVQNVTRAAQPAIPGLVFPTCFRNYTWNTSGVNSIFSRKKKYRRSRNSDRVNILATSPTFIDFSSGSSHLEREF